MQVKEIKSEGLNQEFEITIPANDIDKRVDEKLIEAGKTINMPGFRKGKVPLKMLKQRFGKSVLGEVLESTVNETTSKLMEERKIRPALQPKIEVKEFDEGKDLVYSMAVEALPEFDVMDLKTIKIEKPVCEVEDKAVNEALEKIADQTKVSEAIKSKRATKEGDFVLIDFDGKKKDGTSYPGMASENFELELGSGQFIPGFEEQLIGKKAGDELDVDVTFPENYGMKDLAGEAAVFSVKIHEIREAKKAEINDELAKKANFEDLDAMKKAIQESIERDYGQLSKLRVKKALLDVLDENHDFPLPEGMVEMEHEGIIRQVEQENSMNPDGASELTDEDKEELKDIAARRVRLGLILSDIGTENKIQISNQELQAAVISEAQKYPGQEAQVFEYYQKNPQVLDSLRAPLFEEKVVDFILELADVKEKKVDVDALTADDLDDMPAKKEKKKPAKKKTESKKSDKKAEETKAKKKPAAKKAPAKKADASKSKAKKKS